LPIRSESGFLVRQWERSNSGGVFIAEQRLKNFQKYNTHVENVLKKRAGR
jgi:hypothetical protein